MAELKPGKSPEPVAEAARSQDPEERVEMIVLRDGVWVHGPEDALRAPEGQVLRVEAEYSRAQNPVSGKWEEKPTGKVNVKLKATPGIGKKNDEDLVGVMVRREEALKMSRARLGRPKRF